MKKIFFFFLSIVLLASCSVSKRKYMSGYHIDWNTRAKSIATVSNIKETKSKIQQNKNTSKKNIFESPKAVTQKNNSGISESKNKIAVQQNSSIGKIFFPRLIKPITLLKDSLKTNPKKINSTLNNNETKWRKISLLSKILMGVGLLLFGGLLFSIIRAKGVANFGFFVPILAGFFFLLGSVLSSISSSHIPKKPISAKGKAEHENSNKKKLKDSSYVLILMIALALVIVGLFLLLAYVLFSVL